ncbi:MAG TPA: phosphatase PAP2 family protein [Vicinamibacterales bacterium]|nr:phosphatase PAP2 family protein [Vicinamibacterales bacterium]
MLNTACVLALTIALQSGPVSPPPSSPPPPAAGPAKISEPGRSAADDLFLQLGADFKRLPSAQSGLILGIGGLTTLLVHQKDDEVSDWADDSGASSYSKIGKFLGDGWVQGGVAVGAYVVGRAFKHPRATDFGADLFRAQLMNGLFTQGLKVSVRRERPSGGNKHSMPSGHTSATFASASVIHRHFGWKAGIPAYGVASVIGWSRVRDNTHWLSDVTLGATIGLIAGHTVARGNHTWQVAPVKTSGGFAVYVSKGR